MHFAVVSGVERADQVRMIKLRLGANLASEVGDRLGGRLVHRQHFNRALAAHHLVDRLEHLAHAALADPVGDDVGPQVQLGAPRFQLFGLVIRQDRQVDHAGGSQFIVHRRSALFRA